jgi:NitT/TauT family transport system ATP-binding protein
MSVAEHEYVSLSHISVEYEAGRPVLDDFSMAVKAGEFVCILGPSGCGKSTLLSVLSGLLEPRAGSVGIAGHDLYEGGDADERPRLGFVFQDPRLLPWRSIYDNIAFALTAAGVPAAQHEERVMKYLRMLQIPEHRDSWPLNVSGGQRQRAGIARALAVEPLYVLMDEPFSTLDEVTARTLRHELLAVWERTRTTVIFVTHSIREAVFLADRIFIMAANPGRLHAVREIGLGRPRSYEDPRLTEVEAEIVADVLGVWGVG